MPCEGDLVIDIIPRFAPARVVTPTPAGRLSAVLVALLLAAQAMAGTIPALGAAATATPIKHVVIVMMENHSFDNLFGVYPTMNSSSPSPLLSSLQAPDDVLGAPASAIRSLSQVPNGTSSTANPDEGVYPADWDNGKMDGFAANSGSVSMTYFSSSQLAVEWDWAEQYAIGDRYFANCLCETNPNRLYSLAGYGAGIATDAGPPPYIPVNQSIFSELSHYGVSWGYYIENPAADYFPLNNFLGFGPSASPAISWHPFNGRLLTGPSPPCPG